jgi:hypothetical protein
VLSALLEELESRLVTIYPTISFGTGARDLAHQRALPSVVWVPTTAKHDAPRKSTNPKNLRTRIRTIVAHCWAVADGDDPDGRKSLDACDELVSNLIVALHKVAWGSVRTVGEDWIQPDEISHGHACLVTFEIETPVQDRPYVKAKIATIQADTVGSVAGDTNVDWGEP